jgi:hypothetical protein
MSVMDYVAELNRLWADLDHYDPINLPHVCDLGEEMDRKRRVLQFLRGLNSDFEDRRAAMFYQPTLPSLEEAISAIAQEEMRQKFKKENELPPPRPVFAAIRKRETRNCFNCGETGHLFRNCPQPSKSNRGRGRDMYRGTPRGGRGRGGKGHGYGVGAEHQANAILIEADESSDKELKTICSTENVTNLSHSAPDTHSKWILDSGASQHVTGRYSSFSSYTPYSYTHKETIQTADGACHPIKGVGVVQCTPSIKLSSVLYFPSFPVNLISISALIDYMDCHVSLDHDFFYLGETNREETWDWCQA